MFPAPLFVPQFNSQFGPQFGSQFDSQFDPQFVPQLIPQFAPQFVEGHWQNLQEAGSRQREVQNMWYLDESQEIKIVETLTPYILTSEQLLKYGYPIEASDSSSCAIINYTPYPTAKQPAQESHNSNSVQSQQKICVRCSKPFFNDVSTHPCIYHWGKLWNNRTNNVTSKYWTCCHGTEFAIGCTTARKHVWTGLQPGFNGPLTGFVHTKMNKNTAQTLRVAAIDCEMCFTEAGLEVVKVTLVHLCGTIVYEKLIKPTATILDYNTKFSGISEKDMQNITDDLQTVQRDLLQFISSETILIGHALENDLRGLRIIHNKIIDTSVIFPHYYGFPYRNSLKNLAKRILNRIIQKTSHDSAEDAKTAIDLILTIV